MRNRKLTHMRPANSMLKPLNTVNPNISNPSMLNTNMVNTNMVNNRMRIRNPPTPAHSAGRY